jgi:hypothetical protein
LYSDRLTKKITHGSARSCIHPSAQKGNLPKVLCRMPHSPARWPPYGRPETSRLLKVDHYMLHVRIKMRLGGCAASSQSTDAKTGGRVAGVHGWGDCRRSGLSDIGVYTSRFEDRNIQLSTLGRREVVHRLQRRVRGLRRTRVKVRRIGAAQRDNFPS